MPNEPIYAFAAERREFVARFRTPVGHTAGLGVLVGPREVLTCAHVVNAALGRDQRAQDAPKDQVRVEFPLVPTSGSGPVVHARVTCWLPPPRPGAAGDDIAGLVIAESEPMPAVRPARLAPATPGAGRIVDVFGYPGTPPRPDGGWVEATVRGEVEGERLQLDSTSNTALRIQPGYSGSPLCDRETNRVVGILSSAPAAESGERDSYATTASRLRRSWREVLDSRGIAAGDGSSDRRITVLHVSGLCLARPAAPGTGGLTGTDNRAEPWTGTLHTDLGSLATQHDLRPDLIVVTGDLTAGALPSEFDQAGEILAALADAVDLPHNRVAIVPGQYDINHHACEAYFLRQAAAELTPVEPFWPKWENYASALRSFYGETAEISFSPDEPWTLLEMPEINVVVAGLNSTMPLSHRDPGGAGGLTVRQLEWFAERLADYRDKGWLRIAAMHHNASGTPTLTGNLSDATDLHRLLIAPGLTNIVLHGDSGPDSILTRDAPIILSAGPGPRGAAPPTYQIVSVWSDRLTRRRRRYNGSDHRWTDDVEWDGGRDTAPTSRSHSFAELQPASADQLPAMSRGALSSALPIAGHELFDQVVEATRISQPDAIISPRPESLYLRVTIPIAGGGCEQWPVGVAPLATPENLNDFIVRVHAQFAAADPQVRSQLVHAGEPASDELHAAALAAGVRLRSFVEYSGLIPMEAFLRRQSTRLAADPIYPETGYLEQRFRILDDGEGTVRDGLLDQVIDWLRTDGPRFVMLLGDFGRGKSYLLRQLALRLRDHIASAWPVLLELGTLEKASSLDALLAQQLYRYQVDGVTEAKLRYMITSGRVVILCDGFDELELRVGYNNAPEYLQTLLAAVTGRAKVVVTSRTQHFRSSNQIRTALRSADLPPSSAQVVMIEDFTEAQIVDVLAAQYQGDRVRAQRRFRLLANTPELIELCRNPRMLSFAARLEDTSIRDIERGEQVSAARLYEQLVNAWLDWEVKRHRNQLERTDILRASTDLALRLWRSDRTTFPISDLADAVAHTLQSLSERGYTDDEATQAIGSGSLLVRSGDGAFSFIHRSVMEWLVAKAAATELHTAGASSPLVESKRFSSLMVDFLCDLYGHERAALWATSMLSRTDVPEAAKHNALAINTRIRVTAQKRLRGVDLRGQDITGWDLREADLRDAILRHMTITDTDFDGADLRGADLTGARIIGGSLGDALLTGSTWDRATLMSVAGVEALASAPELTHAAITGRDPAEPMLATGGPALSLSASTDGSLLAVGRRSGVELIDLTAGQTVRVLRGHTGEVWGVDFSPVGQLIGTGSMDGTTAIWTSTGTLCRILRGHTGPVWSVAFNPRGDLIATASHDHTARIWQAATGQPLMTLTGHAGPVWAVAFSPDGASVATASADYTARVWDCTTFRSRTILTGHSDGVRALAFSPGGQLIATASNDHTVRVWDADSGSVRTALTGHAGPVSAVSFSPDGTLIASGSHDHSARVWQTGSGQSHGAVSVHTGAVNAVRFTPEGQQLITASDDGAVRINDVYSGAARMSIGTAAGWIWDVSFSDAEAVLAVESQDHEVSVWRTRSGRRIARVPRSGAAIVAAACSPNGDSLAIADADHLVRVFPVSGDRSDVTLAHGVPVRAACFSPNGKLLATACNDSAARIWDGTTGELVRVMTGHTHPINAVVFSPDGHSIVTSSDDATARVWHTDTGVARATLVGHELPVRAVALSPDGSLIATASDDGTVAVWSGTDVRLRLIGHTGWILGVSVSPDGRLVATASADATARVWNVADGTRRHILAGHCAAVRKVAFSPTGDRLATVSDDGNVLIWAIATGELAESWYPLTGGGYARICIDGTYSIHGADPGNALWWAVKLSRFSPGELDRHDPRWQRRDLPPG